MAERAPDSSAHERPARGAGRVPTPESLAPVRVGRSPDDTRERRSVAERMHRQRPQETAPPRKAETHDASHAHDVGHGHGHEKLPGILALLKQKQFKEAAKVAAWRTTVASGGVGGTMFTIGAALGVAGVPAGFTAAGIGALIAAPFVTFFGFPILMDKIITYITTGKFSFGSKGGGGHGGGGGGHGSGGGHH